MTAPRARRVRGASRTVGPAARAPAPPLSSHPGRSTGEEKSVPCQRLTTYGYGPEQAYLLLGAAPIEGRPSGVVDIPNSCATVYIPTSIFDFDVTAGKNGPVQIDPGQGAPRASR